jgi:hypothetical protein
MAKRFIFSLGLLVAIVIGCLSHQEGLTHSATGDELRNIVVSRRTLTDRGGRVDWCASTHQIAFDHCMIEKRSLLY